MNRDIRKRFINRIKDKEKLTLSEAALYIDKSERTVLRYVTNKTINRYFGRGTGVQGYYLKKELDIFNNQII